MKNLNIYYWITTTIFAAFMLLSAVPDVMMTKEVEVFMQHLGYPNYFTVFIGVAKILGVIAILIPGFPRIKEWAYAGLFFDLVGATYSNIAVDGVNGGIIFMAVVFAFFFASYFLYHRKLKA